MKAWVSVVKHFHESEKCDPCQPNNAQNEKCLIKNLILCVSYVLTYDMCQCASMEVPNQISRTMQSSEIKYIYTIFSQSQYIFNCAALKHTEQ